MELSPIDALWVLASAVFVFFMQAGFMGLETGLSRTKNSINVAIKNLTDTGISVVLFWAVGFGLMFGASWLGFLGTTRFLVGADADHGTLVFFLFQAMFAATATTILSGAVAERMRFAGYLLIASVVSGAIYPVFGHWAWGGSLGDDKGWLANAGFVDFAGSTVVHSVGGWVSLAAVLVIGARANRFDESGNPRRLTHSNVPLAVLGVFILWMGWYGFNGGSTLAFDGRVPLVLLNTTLGGAAGLLSSLLISRLTEHRWDVLAAMNGSLAGLVAITASAHASQPVAALAIGAGGGIVAWAVDRLLLKYRIDDAVGAVPVHLGAGIWGTLAVALLADPVLLGTGLSRMDQLRIQLAGIAACGIWAFGTAFVALKTIDRMLPLRVTAAEEADGLNVSEHGASTELYDLVSTIEHQTRTGDLSGRVPADPFSELGQIARHYNGLLTALEAAEDRTSSLVASAPLGILTVDFKTRRIAQFNPKAAEILERAGRSIHGQGLDGALGHDRRPDDPVEHGVLRADGKTVVSWVVRGPGGCAVPIEMIVAQLNGGSRLVLLRDVSEERVLQQRLQHQERVVTLSSMVAGVAHEVNNPLAFVKTNEELARMELDDLLAMEAVRHEPELERRLKELREQIGTNLLGLGRIERINQSLKRFASPDRGHREPVDLNDTIEGVLLLAHNRLKRSHTIHRDFTRIPPVHGSSQELGQVFLNLVLNAVEATPEGGTIHVETHCEDGRVVARVRDSGPGIADSMRDRLFSAFATSKTDGTGLGLYLSRRIVQDHGGRLSLEENSDTGASFRIELPLNGDVSPAASA